MTPHCFLTQRLKLRPKLFTSLLFLWVLVALALLAPPMGMPMKAGNQPPPPPVAVALDAQADPTLDWLTRLVISMVEVLLVRLGNPQ